MDNLFLDPILIISTIIGTISLILIFILIEQYKKIKDNQFVDDVLKTSTQNCDEKINSKESHNINKEKNISSEIKEVNIKEITNETNSSDKLLYQINELTNQINNINENIKDLRANIEKFFTKPSQNIDNDKYNEKLLSVLKDIETLVSTQQKIISENNKNVLEEINAKLDNILQVLSAILQQ